jgi:hypothetical protein
LAVYFFIACYSNKRAGIFVIFTAHHGQLEVFS